MRRYEIKLAGPIWGTILRLLGYGAITLPTKRIYILPEQISPALIAHEKAHIAQIELMGPCRFWWKICTDFIVHGYENSPLEIKAREIEGRYAR